MTELQKFVEENQETIAKHAPKGWKYLGTYFYVLGFGPYHLAVMWEITDYADLDTMRDHDDPIFWNIIEKKFALLKKQRRFSFKHNPLQKEFGEEFLLLC